MPSPAELFAEDLWCKAQAQRRGGLLSYSEGLLTSTKFDYHGVHDVVVNAKTNQRVRAVVYNTRS